MQFILGIDASIIRSYRRLGYKAWYALAEFIDNSTQSWEDNRPTLQDAEGGLIIEVTIEQDLIRVYDNAMGMDADELENALRIGRQPTDTAGRSEFGLGMKTAACWFGNEWSVRTKKLGHPYEYEVTVDVERVATGDLSLKSPPPKEKDINTHYTVIEVKQLNRPIHHRTIARLKEYISSMYRVDLRESRLLIDINASGVLEAWHFGEAFLKAKDGSEYRREFQKQLESSRTVEGWLGILASGGRAKGGIAIIRRGRVIEGQPRAWKPSEIYGESRNDLINQRLVGEIHLDEFGVSHTKDTILWEDNDELELEEYLAAEFQDFRKTAATPYWRLESTDEPQVSEMEIDAALEELRAVLEDPSFADSIELQEVPTEAVVEQSKRPMTESVQNQSPTMEFKIGDIDVRLFLNAEVSANDPYYVCEWPGHIIVNVNLNHVHFKRGVKDANSLMLYLLDCVYDGLAEWKCAKKTGDVNHETIKFLKDGLLRQHVERLDA